MKKIFLMSLALLIAVGGYAQKQKAMKNYTLTTSWQSKDKKYKNFTDLGNYTIMLNDANIESDNDVILHQGNQCGGQNCTATAKLNSKGEVIIGRNQDLDVSQMPAFVQCLHGKKHDVMLFTYSGPTGKYRYDQLNEIDKDEEFIRCIPSEVGDAMNDAGLYIEANMREDDPELKMACDGTNPGKQKACFTALTTLVALNCSTVDEALAYIRNSYDWYGSIANFIGTPFRTNLAFMIGDAKGNFGLIEFANNKMEYFPYCPGQANFYMHPAFTEYANYGTGYGRLAAPLKNLESCETEQDMMKNMESCMWIKEITNPGILGYSDIENSLAVRRSTPKKILQAKCEEQLNPVKPLAEEYAKGNEKPLRDAGNVWTTSLHVGANCHTKHIMVELWERNDLVLDIQWK